MNACDANSALLRCESIIASHAAPDSARSGPVSAPAWPATIQAGVVDEDRRRAEPRDDLGDRRVDRARDGGVDDMRRDGAPESISCGQQRLRAARRHRTAADRRTGGGQRARVTVTEAAETSGDDGDAAIEAKWVGSGGKSVELGQATALVTYKTGRTGPVNESGSGDSGVFTR